MNWKLFWGYMLAAAIVIILGLATFIVLTNFDPWELHVIWKTYTLPQAAWLLIAGASGAIVWYTIHRLLPLSIRVLKEGTKRKRAQQQTQAIKELQKERGKEDKPES